MGNNFYCGTAWTQIHLEVSKNNIFSCMASAGEKNTKSPLQLKMCGIVLLDFFVVVLILI